MSVQAAITNLNQLVAGLSGLVRVYSDPPESISEFPAALTYIGQGEMTATAAGGYSLHTLIVEIYHARQVLAQAVNEAKVWPDRLYAALKADETLGGAVSHVVWPIRYQALPLPYNDLIHFGVRFTIQVKVNET